MTATPHVDVRDVEKRFGGVRALGGVSVAIQRGTVHALVGENGAGKSTLAKVIAGVHSPKRGAILVNGEQVRFRSPRDALERGITMIAQELALVPERSVMENVFLAHEPRTAGIVRSRALRKRYREVADRLRFECDPDEIVSRLRVAEQQQVEILRALVRNAQMLIMDEPTAALPHDDAERLLGLIRELRDAGTTVVFVSHFLHDVLGVADTITVLRDGELVETAPAQGETPSGLVGKMLGRPLSLTFPPKSVPPPDEAVLLEVDGLARPPLVEDVSLSVRSGEIVGLAGLVGSGRTEVLRGIFGADRIARGTVTLAGRTLSIRSPRDAARQGIAMLPEARKTQGLHLNLRVADNVTLATVRRIARLGLVQRSREESLTRDLLERLGVRPSDPSLPVDALSGGNQQKVLFAKWLAAAPVVLLADEPTRGVDVGSKRAIYDLIVSLAADGLGVLFVSSELEEVVGLSHRVLVMRSGRVVAELQGDRVNEADVMREFFEATGVGNAA